MHPIKNKPFESIPACFQKEHFITILKILMIKLKILFRFLFKRKKHMLLNSENKK